MKNKGLLFTLIATLILVVVGCSSTKETEPVAVDAKNDKCANCNMAVADDQFATEVIKENGKALKFDDLGCLYKWTAANEDVKLKAKFVRDYTTEEWVSLDKATYVYDKNIKTPMAFNVISFKNKKAAENFVSDNGGDVLTATDLDKHDWVKNMDMMNSNESDMNMD